MQFPFLKNMSLSTWTSKSLKFLMFSSGYVLATKVFMKSPVCCFEKLTKKYFAGMFFKPHNFW